MWKAMGRLSPFRVTKISAFASVHTPLSLFLRPEAMSPWEQNGKHSAFKAVGWTGASWPAAETDLAHASKHIQPFNSQTWALA